MNQYSYIDFKFEQGNGKLCAAALQNRPFPHTLASGISGCGGSSCLWKDWESVCCHFIFLTFRLCVHFTGLSVSL